MVLALGTFVLVIYATFLTRSGILANFSVHSFSDLGGYRLLLGFLVFYVVLCLGLLCLRWKTIPAPKDLPPPGARDLALIAGIITLVLFGLVVLIGTSYPIIGHAAVEPRFYNCMAVPIAIAVAGLTIFVSFTTWGIKKRPRMPRLGSGAFVAHLGAVLLILGVVLSSMGASNRLVLSRGGPPKYADGFEFSYQGSTVAGDNKEVAIVTAARGGFRLDLPLSLQYTENGVVRAPAIHSFLSGDLYISPADLRETVVSPTASMTEKGWVAAPVRVPGTDASLALSGMQVEERAVKLQYQSPRQKPVEIEVSQRAPATIDGCRISFLRFVQSGNQMMDMTAGASVVVTGRNLTERALIEVSNKPLIWVLWLGAVLMLLGGAMALRRRYAESKGRQLWRTTQ